MEVSGELHAPPALPPRKERSVPIAYDAGWAPEPVWRLWRREKYIGPVGNQTSSVKSVVRRYID
jgi:hypothetical protein